MQKLIGNYQNTPQDPNEETSTFWYVCGAIVLILIINDISRQGGGKSSITINCYNCNKPLSDPISVKLGIGPDCRKQVGIGGRNQGNNIFGNRAEYSWGTDGKILWLKDNGTHCRSLTNDLENCLCEIQAELKDTPLTAFTIVYKDSEGEWDGVQITKFDQQKIIDVDVKWIEHKAGAYHPNYLGIDFYFIGAKGFNECKERIGFIKVPAHLS